MLITNVINGANEVFIQGEVQINNHSHQVTIHAHPISGTLQHLQLFNGHIQLLPSFQPFATADVTLLHASLDNNGLISNTHIAAGSGNNGASVSGSDVPVWGTVISTPQVICR